MVLHFSMSLPGLAMAHVIQVIDSQGYSPPLMALGVWAVGLCSSGTCLYSFRLTGAWNWPPQMLLRHAVAYACCGLNLPAPMLWQTHARCPGLACYKCYSHQQAILAFIGRTLHGSPKQNLVMIQVTPLLIPCSHCTLTHSQCLHSKCQL